MRLVWTLVLQLSYLTMAVPSVTQEGTSIVEPPAIPSVTQECHHQELMISRQSETILRLEETIAEQNETIEWQNETIEWQNGTIQWQNGTILKLYKTIEELNETIQDSGPSCEAEAGLLLITGGSGSLSSVEVYPSTSGCSPPDLPAGRCRHTTFLTAGPNPAIATCGGVVGRDGTASCLVLDKSNHRWDESRMGDLTMPRDLAAVATLNSVGVFIIGGSGTNKKRTSDFLAAGQMQWQEGPPLPVDMEWGPCAVTITPTSFLSIFGDHICEFDAAIDGPTSINGWREAGRLKTSRTEGPGCVKVGQKVIIAGGWNEGALCSTEVLDLDSREITAGEDMVSPRHWFHLATIRREGQEKVFAVGGLDDSTYLNTVEELVEEEESTTWATADSFLGERKGTFGALALPEELICPA